MKIMNRIKITKNRVVACFAAIMLLLPATVGAQHFDAHIAGRKVTLQECFDLAARQNLQMQAGKKSVERAQVMQGTAWELDKTEVAFSQNPATGGESDNGFTFTQSLDFPTVYASRRNQLKAETQAEKSRLNVVSQQLKAEIANTYYQMLYQTPDIGANRLSIRALQPDCRNALQGWREPPAGISLSRPQMQRKPSGNGRCKERN